MPCTLMQSPSSVELSTSLLVYSIFGNFVYLFTVLVDVYVCVPYTYGAQDNQKMLSDLQGLELQIVVSH